MMTVVTQVTLKPGREPEWDSAMRDRLAAAHGRPEPAVTVEGRGTIRAATLARARLGDAAALVNDRAVTDPQEPLVAGDVVRVAGARER